MNGTGFIQELMEMVTRRAKVIEQLEAQLEDAKQESEAIRLTLRLHLKDHSIPELLTETDSEPSGTSLTKRRGAALVTWAKAHNGILRPKEAKKALVAAGLIKPGPGAGWIIYGTLPGMECWEKLEPGVYKLIGYQPQLTNSDNGQPKADVLIPSAPEKEPDYWRCPDGKLHEWQYFRNVETANGIYMCKLCPMQTDKATLKAKTDGGPKLYLEPVGG